MRWLVEVSSLGKTDLQKFCVEAESWQRALQAARAQRGEEGPMSGFSIELLEEGYRAVDPLARVRFVVKRAPDDMAVTAPLAKTPNGGVAPSPPSVANAPASSTAVTEPKLPPSPASSSPATKSVPPRPLGDKGANGPSSKKGVTLLEDDAKEKATSSKTSASTAPPAKAGHSASTAPPAQAGHSASTAQAGHSAPPPVGSPLSGLPAVKLLSSREQNPTEASPLTYREYSFAVPAGTDEDVAVAVLRGQLKVVDAHLSDAKMGKLVNLAVFDVEFTGKPPSPPIATLTWKDWKGDPVIGHPRRGAAQKQVKPPSGPPATSPSTTPPSSTHFPPPSSMPPSSIPRPGGLAVATAPVASSASPAAPPQAAAAPPAAPPAPAPGAPAAPQPAAAPSAAPAAPQPAGAPSAAPAPVAPAAPQPALAPSAAPAAPSAAPAAPHAASGAPHAASGAPQPAAAQPGFPSSASSVPPANALSSTTPLIPQSFVPQPLPASAQPPAHASAQPPAVGAGGIPVPVVAPVAVFQPGPPGSIPPPAAGVGSIPPPAGGAPAPATAPATASVPAPAIAHAPSSSEPPPPRRSAPDGMVRTPSGRFVRGRTTGDELITALFESMHDLHFLRDALDGGQFCLALATEVLPARVALIHFFDVEKREWVIACTRGKDSSRLLTLRTPESDELLREAARNRRALVSPNGTNATAQRYQMLGGSRSMIIAPIMQAGRALGAIEIINPLDGMPFTEDEGNAMTYIAEQYAEYLGSRGIVLDTQRIQNAAAPR